MDANLIFVGIILTLARGIVSLEHLSGQFGWFNSKGYPETYENNLNQQWEIEVRDGFRIEIRFTQFDLEDSYEDGLGPCLYDFVKIEEDDHVIARFCGNLFQFPWDAPRDSIYTKKNKTKITFVSDYSNENINPRGFLAHYTEIDIDECAEMDRKRNTVVEDWDLLVTCNHHCHNVPGSYYCSCKAGYVLHSNSHTCIATFCENQELTTDEGVIASPGYPDLYSKWANCSWDIQVREGLSIMMQFEREFEIEIYTTDPLSCLYDSLQLTYDGAQKVYCGSEAPGNGSIMDMNTRHVKVEFQSDFSVEKTGFKLKYTTSRIKCLKALHDPENGFIVNNQYDQFEFEDVVEFACNRGYRQRGERFLNCLSNGKWDHPVPTCEIKSCGEPTKLRDVPHGHIVNLTSLNYLGTLTVECDEWYEQTAGTAKWVCEDGEEWVENGTRIAPNPNLNLPKCRPKCGIKGPSANTYLQVQISGGTVVERHEFPWMVFLNFGRDRYLRASYGICGGSLISSRYVLTAAHCMVGLTPNHIHLWFGAHNRNESESTVKYAKAEKIIRHPLYSKSSQHDHDIALVRLNESLTMNEKYRPVCLPKTSWEQNFSTPGSEGQVAGWGLFEYARGSSQQLLKTTFPVVDSAHCWVVFQKAAKEQKNALLKNRSNITNSMFCAGFQGGEQATCSGDSGSPFVMKNSLNGKYYESGLVSFGPSQCERIISYTVYAKLTKEIVDWILLNTNDLE